MGLSQATITALEAISTDVRAGVERRLSLVGLSASQLHALAAGILDSLKFTTKTLVGGAATSFATVAVAAGAGNQVGGIIHYTVKASDGTDHQCIKGSVKFALVNKAGAETVDFSTPDEAFAESAGDSTLAVTFDGVAGANLVTMRANAVSSLTETTLTMIYRIDPDGPATVAHV